MNLPTFCKPKYRIVTDDFLGFEAQKWVWWWPFWICMNDMGNPNSHVSVEQAEQFIRRAHRNRTVVKIVNP